MKKRGVVDSVKDALMSMAPHPVSYMRIAFMDFRSSDPKIQVVDLRRR